MKAVILAGGKGRRLAPYTTVFPKPLVPLGDRPILDLIIRQLAHHGFNEIVLTVGYLAELIQAYFQTAHDGLPDNISLSYVKETTPLGTAGSLALVEGLDEPFLVMNGDVLTTLEYSKMMAYHKEHGNALTIGTYEKKMQIELGVLDINADNHITAYHEKPVHVYPVSIGVYIYDPLVLDYITPGEHLDFPDLVRTLLDDGQKVMAYPCEGYWLDIGNPGDYQRALEEYEDKHDLFLPKDES